MISPTRFIFDALGTRWTIDITDPLEADTKEDLLSRILARIGEYDRTYSRFRDDSLVAQMAASAGRYKLPVDAKPLLDLYQELYTLTRGKFTPLIGNVLIQAGYDAEYSLQPKQLAHPPAWEEALEYIFPEIEIKQPQMLDFGAAGKGYAIDLVAQLLQREGLTEYCVEAGGDMVYVTPSHTPLRVGLEHPENTQQVIGVVDILNQSICGSAGNRRRWGKYHHIIDPQLLASPQEILSVWVIADNALLADGLSTSLFFVSPDVLDKKFTFEYLLVYQDYSINKSQGFNAELFFA